MMKSSSTRVLITNSLNILQNLTIEFGENPVIKAICVYFTLVNHRYAISKVFVHPSLLLKKIVFSYIAKVL